MASFFARLNSPKFIPVGVPNELISPRMRKIPKKLKEQIRKEINNINRTFRMSLFKYWQTTLVKSKFLNSVVKQVFESIMWIFQLFFSISCFRFFEILIQNKVSVFRL